LIIKLTNNQAMINNGGKCAFKDGIGLSKQQFMRNSWQQGRSPRKP
jgi:hypothetical protein